jgi:hypothetical protein
VRAPPAPDGDSRKRSEEAFTYHADLKGRQIQILDPTTAIVNGVRGSTASIASGRSV